MNKKIIFSIFFVFFLTIFTIPTVYAATYSENTVKIFTEKEIYSYGDYLTFTIEVSKIKDDIAILHIIDEAGISSSAIPILINKLKTIVPSPYPFESETYPEGKYILNLEYGEISTSTEFELIDSGNIVIPYWIRDVSTYWYNGEISDNDFASGIGFLIKEKIIVVPEIETRNNQNEVKIPQWIKTSTKWWLDGSISDTEFAQGLQYLIKIGIIVV